MSYDFDHMLADYEQDSLIIIIGMNYYEYTLSSTRNLFEGGKANGVDYEVHGHPEDAEDYDEEFIEDYGDYEREADRYNFLRDWDEYREW